MSTATITSRAELLAFVAQVTPAEHVAATSVRALAADAPVLPPIKMPRLSDKTLNGRRVQEVLDAGKKAALVHTPRGLRVVEDLAAVADDPTVVVLAQWRELSRAVTVEGQSTRDVAVKILDRELDVIARLERTAA